MKQRNNTKRRRALIRARLFLSGITQTEIARRVGVSRGLVCHVIAGRKTHLAVRRALAKAIRMNAEELWGD